MKFWLLWSLYMLNDFWWFFFVLFCFCFVLFVCFFVLFCFVFVSGDSVCRVCKLDVDTKCVQFLTIEIILPWRVANQTISKCRLLLQEKSWPTMWSCVFRFWCSFCFCLGFPPGVFPCQPLWCCNVWQIGIPVELSLFNMLVDVELSMLGLLLEIYYQYLTLQYVSLVPSTCQ